MAPGGAHTIARWTQFVRYNQHDCRACGTWPGYVAEACSADAYARRQQALATERIGSVYVTLGTSTNA